MTDARFVRLQAAQGYEGLGMMNRIRELLACQPDGLLQRDDIDAWAFRMACSADRLRALIELCLTLKIFKESKAGIYSEEVLTAIESINKDREGARERMRAIRELRKKEESSKAQKQENQIDTEEVHPKFGGTSPEVLSISSSLSLNSRSEVKEEVQEKPSGDPPHWPPQIRETDFLAPWLRDAYLQFDPQSECCLGSGRRPMKLYPEIWISPHELAEIFRSYEKKLPKDEWRRVFQKVRTWALSKIDEGKNPKRLNTPGALLGWALDEVIESLTKSVRLNKARGGSTQ